MQIRPIEPTDEKLYRSILERTSEEDRYCRFFHAVDHFDPREIRQYVAPGPNMFGFIAIQDNRSLGASHACLLEPDSAELAIVVASDARRRGVGTALFARIVSELRARGRHRLIACALSENHALANLARKVGMKPETHGLVIVWSLTDSPAPAV